MAIGLAFPFFIVYLLLGVFLAGLMTGRTPELFGRKLETPQVRLLALLVLLQPITLLVFTAITLAVPGLAGTSNPGFHGISQVFCEYVSAYANNGSGFEGLGEVGVIFLLFTIGLDVSFARLWTLRRQLFGLGSAQVAPLLEGSNLAAESGDGGGLECG